MNIKGYISEYDGENLTIIAPFSDSYILERRRIAECEIRLDDGRTISADQRKKIYATMRDIADYTGYMPDEVKAIWKYNFIAKTGCEYFSLSNVDMTTANEFLNYLIEFCIEHGIAADGSLLDRSPDIARYIMACLVHKKCAVCGKKAELHHAEDRVGAGRNRKEIIHHGMRVIPLCRTHHTECHNIGQETFNQKWKLYGIKADDYICKVWRLKSENR